MQSKIKYFGLDVVVVSFRFFVFNNEFFTFYVRAARFLLNTKRNKGI
jgi:hypothetical protein